MSGFLFNDVCYSSAALAADAYYSSIEPVVTAGSTPLLTVFEKVSNTWYLVVRDASSVIFSNAVSTPSFAGCNPLDYVSDGLELGFWVIGVFAVAWGFKALQRVF